VVEAKPAQAQEDREARHRRGDRPRSRCAPTCKQRLAESFEAACAWPTAAPSRWRWTWRGRGAPVQQQVRLPGVQLLAARAGAAPVLVQLAPVGACPAVRRPGPGHGVRPGARGGLPHAEPGQRRHQGLGPAQRLHFACWRAWRALRLRHRHAVRGLPASGAAGAAARLGRGRDRVQSTSWTEGTSKGKKRSVKRKHPFEGIIPNMARRYRETDSVAVREDLARYRSTQPCPNARARACGARRAM
jgi:hypothetical protein